MDLDKNIREWVNLDNQLVKLKNQEKEIKKQQDSLSQNILEYANTKNILNSTIKISDGRLNFIEQKHTTILSYQFLNKCLINYFKNQNEVDKIIKYIKTQRETDIKQVIKRTYLK
jgi:hypothetical protein